MTLDNCIASLRQAAGKPDKFSRLENKFRNRFSILFAINVGNIGKMTAGFDNHRNHQRPHIHIDTKNKRVGRISIAIDNGELLHKKNKNLNNDIIKEIQDWVAPKKECLKLIYENIQNCLNQSDFEELINAINQYL